MIEEKNNIQQKLDDEKQQAYEKLRACGIKPSVQRLAIMQYLLTHITEHPTVEDVYNGLYMQIPTLSRTTVYNTLRMFSEHKAAQMITIDEHRVCYDGLVKPHVHFLCRKCGMVINMMGQKAPHLSGKTTIEGCLVDEAQLYYKGVCEKCNK